MRYEDMINGLAEEMLEKIAEDVEQEELEKESSLAGIAKRTGQLLTGSKAKSLKGAVNRAGNIMTKAENAGDVAKFYKAQDLQGAATKALKKERMAVAGARTAVGVGAGAGIAALQKQKVQEKAAGYFEEAEFLKQAAEEAYNEALMMQDAAVALFNRMEEE